jgi:light-regulated signal transduction histidine kinase (bacteriophytochrome)
MGQRIDQFCENLRQKLTRTDSGLEGLKTKIDAKKANVEQDVQSHLDRVRNRIEQNQAKLAAAQTNMKNWVDERKATTSAQIADWKAKRDAAKLQSRAGKAEDYAAAAIDVAVAAVDEAEKASLEAWLARADADAAQTKPAAVA